MYAALNPQDTLKRRFALATLSFSIAGTIAATIFHYLESSTNPLHWLNLWVPPLSGVMSSILLIRLYKKPETLQQTIYLGLLTGVFLVTLPSWLFTLQAFTTPKIGLVDSLPPSTIILFILATIIPISSQPRRSLKIIIATWIAIATPILAYLILHPAELRTLRGLDIIFTLGPGMGLEIFLMLFYLRLQNLVDRLYAERLQYYSQVIERQSIRHQAMEQAFSQIHNGPLQTLALLLRDVRHAAIPSERLWQRLTELNAEIRAVGRSLTDEGELPDRPIDHRDPLNGAIAEQTLRLGEGTYIDLSQPLHNLLHQVYSLTLKRNLPHFQTIRIKVRNFDPLQPSNLTLEMKRDLCLWLEEALCNVGKHAQGATRIVATGARSPGCYLLKIQDNGSGLKPSLGKRGTQQCELLAERLDGRFRREALPQGGTICELSWPIALSSESDR